MKRRQNYACQVTKGSLISDYFKNGAILYDADPKCVHEVHAQWSGVKCRWCPGWFCY